MEGGFLYRAAVRRKERAFFRPAYELSKEGLFQQADTSNKGVYLAYGIYKGRTLSFQDGDIIKIPYTNGGDFPARKSSFV